ncbi:MAG TPA: type II toxin-antitoxin system RelE/ParE family toxin [Bryobacteraceae bacterium]|jgi:hypothetical protein
MRIFMSRRFARFARKERIGEGKLLKAVKEIEAGQVDADYGGGVIKQRIARPNAGKSGGYRSIILFRQGGHLFFVYGFAKSERENIGEAELRDFKELAKNLFAATDGQLKALVDAGSFEEVLYEQAED